MSGRVIKHAVLDLDGRTVFHKKSRTQKTNTGDVHMGASQQVQPKITDARPQRQLVGINTHRRHVVDCFGFGIEPPFVRAVECRQSQNVVGTELMNIR